MTDQMTDKAKLRDLLVEEITSDNVNILRVRELCR
jgi:hypothetical protein